MADEPEPAPARPSRARGWAWTAALGGAIALVVLVPLIWAIVVLLDRPKAADEQFDYLEGLESQAPLKPGSAGYVVAPPDGSVTAFVSILSIAEAVPPGAGLPAPTAGMSWVGFELEVEGDGVEPIGELTWTLIDGKGAAHPRELPAVTGAGANLEYAPLERGESSRGWVYFTQPEGAGIRELRVLASPFGQALSFVAP
jgi:hypothetical protein